MTQTSRFAFLVAIFVLNFIFITSCFANDFIGSNIKFKIQNNSEALIKIHVFREGIKTAVYEQYCDEFCQVAVTQGDQVFVNIENGKGGYRANWGGECEGAQFARCYFKVNQNSSQLVTLSYTILGAPAKLWSL